MDPALGPTALRGIGSTASALISRYRPAGVPRTGSPEDRAQPYRRFLDAASHVRMEIDLELFRHRTGEDRPATPDEVAVLKEYFSALNNVLLRAPAYVINAAESILASASEVEDDKMTDTVDEALRGFLEAARHDLAYNPKWWHIMSRLRERAYRRKQE